MKTIFILFLLLTPYFPSFADQIKLKDGTMETGKIISRSDSSVVMKVSKGTATVEREYTANEIAEIVSDSSEEKVANAEMKEFTTQIPREPIHQIKLATGAIYNEVSVKKIFIDGIEINFKSGDGCIATANFTSGKVVENFKVTPASSELLAKESNGNGYFRAVLVLASLPEDLQQRFGYNPKKIEELKKRNDQDKMQLRIDKAMSLSRHSESNNKISFTDHFKIFQILNKGFLAYLMRENNQEIIGYVYVTGYPQLSHLHEGMEVVFQHRGGVPDFSCKILSGDEVRFHHWIYVGKMESYVGGIKIKKENEELLQQQQRVEKKQGELDKEIRESLAKLKSDELEKKITKTGVKILIKSVQHTDEGELCEHIATEMDLHSISESSRTGPTIMLKDAPEYIDDRFYECIAKRIGIYKYKTIIGNNATIELWQYVGPVK